MNSNYVICRNEVIIEGENVGQFESFEMQSDSRTFGNTAVLVLPLYALGVVREGAANQRIRNVFRSNFVRPCARVEVYCWYDNAGVSMEKVRVFAGFIEHVVDGFPTKIYLQDNTFVLRFGNIQKGWDGNATLRTIIEDVIPIAQKGFDEERKRNGFTNPIPTLTYSVEKKNVQAVTTSLSFRNWGARSPFDTLQKLQSLLVLFGGVSDDFNVFMGAGVEKSTRPIVHLDTRYNVIARDIVPTDGRFIDFDVKITGILKSGRQYTATGGYGTSRSRLAKSGFEKEYGESHRQFCTADTVEGIQAFADRMLASLRSSRNKGTITLLLYPKVQLMDWVTYTDSVFPDTLNAGYYILGYQFKADEGGYFQTVEVTDKVFML